MECYCYLRNIRDRLSDWKTPYERRFGEPFEGQIVPFGSLVEYHPISTKDQSRIHQFGKKVLPGIFLGYVLYAVRNVERRHTGCGPCFQELEEMDATEIHAERLNAKEVILPKSGENCNFPVADGTVQRHG